MVWQICFLKLQLRKSLHYRCVGSQERVYKARWGIINLKNNGQIPEGWYETNLFWREKHAPLDTNKSGSLGQLNGLLNNLKRNEQLNTYNDIIRDHQENGILEKIDERSQCQNNEYFMPHKAVVREAAQITKYA